MKKTLALLLCLLLTVAATASLAEGIANYTEEDGIITWDLTDSDGNVTGSGIVITDDDGSTYSGVSYNDGTSNWVLTDNQGNVTDYGSSETYDDGSTLLSSTDAEGNEAHHYVSNDGSTYTVNSDVDGTVSFTERDSKGNLVDSYTYDPNDYDYNYNYNYNSNSNTSTRKNTSTKRSSSSNNYYYYDTDADLTYSVNDVYRIDPVTRTVSSSGTLNVRQTPSLQAKIIGHLEDTQKITVVGYTADQTWAMIDYKGKTGYVLTRYLGRESAYYSTVPAPSYAPLAESDMDDLNNQFSSMAQVTPYTVTVHPSRVGGWVNLRWAPSKACYIQRYCYEGEKLTVIALNNNWLQVQDAQTGNIGFIQRTFAY